MANDDHVALLKQGVAAWNAWRAENPKIHPELSEADLTNADLAKTDLRQAALNGANLSGTNLSEANLTLANLSEANLERAVLRGANLYDAGFDGANLSRADLRRANLPKSFLRGANLSWANLGEANLERAYLTGADLSGADLSGANLYWAYMREAQLFKAQLPKTDLQIVDLSKANLQKANLREACLKGAYLREADLSGADLFKADLLGVNFNKANLTGAILEEANLRNAVLVDTNLTKANLNGSRVYGASVWNVTTTDIKQQNLVITSPSESRVTVDNLKVAQFLYLLINNAEIRDVIDTITSKVVLILGRFTAERKAVLDAIREELRKFGFLPILFDFDVPATRDITETVSLLARMSRFIIADLTDPSSIPKELEAIVPGLAVPVQPLIEGSSRPYAMFHDYWKYEWVLPVYRYEGLEPLLATLAEKVIAPAEAKMKALAEQRRRFEAELTKPQ